MSNIYGGDEVGAIVLDIGNYSTKVGYAGEDAPKSEISTIVARHEAPTVGDLDNNESGATSSVRKRKYYVDLTEINVPRSGKEIESFLRDGMIENFDLFEKMIDYIYTRHVQSDSSKHPVMFSEVCWNTKKCREKTTEIMFEKFNIPAFYLAKNAMLAAFSTGRPTCLVFDSGAQHSSAIPVLDGHVLMESIVKTQFGGDYLTGLCYKHLLDRKVDINPAYLVKSKERVEMGEKAKWSRKPIPEGITQSWHQYMIRQEVSNLKTSVFRVFDTKLDLEEAEKLYDPVVYEFPDGFNMEFSVKDQFSIPELFFDSEFKLQADSSISSLPIPSTTYPEIILNSIAKCDIDIRPSLLSSIVLAGGNTLLNGFTERITGELINLAPQNFRAKIVNNNSAVERRYANWIGGSIMASLGTFQQLWVSRSQYEECGKSCIDRFH